jgi:hypothetical protein
MKVKVEIGSIFFTDSPVHCLDHHIHNLLHFAQIGGGGVADGVLHGNPFQPQPQTVYLVEIFLSQPCHNRAPVARDGD